MRKVRFATVGVWTVLLGSLLSIQVLAKRDIRLDDLQALAPQNVTLSLSRDGRYLALSVSGELVVIDARNGRSIEHLGQGILPTWSNNGRKLAFYSTRSGALQLWCWDREQSTLTQLTRLKHGIDADPTTRVGGWVHDAFRYSWSPGDGEIVFASRVALPDWDSASLSYRDDLELSESMPTILTENSPSQYVLRDVFQNPLPGGGVPESRDGVSYTFRSAPIGETLYSQLFVADVHDGSVRQLTSGRTSYFHPMWAPQKHQIVAAAVDGPEVTEHVDSSTLIVIDAKTGSKRVIASGPGVRYQPKWSPNGKAIAYFERNRALARPRIKVLNVEPLTAPSFAPIPDRHVFDFLWSFDGERILIEYKDGTSIRLGQASIKAATFEVISTKEEYPIEITSFATDAGGAIAWFQYDPKSFATVRLKGERDSDSPQILRRLNPAHANLRIGEVRIVAWRSRDGQEREGTVLFPPDFNPGRTYPLIVDAYPLRAGADWTHPLSGNFAWAAHGYVVLRPSGRAPHVWMNPWTDLESSASAKGADGWSIAVDDVMSAVDLLVEEGVVDPTRMCIYGFSNGATVANHLVTQTGRFKCAVSVSPVLANFLRPAMLNPSFVNHYTGDYTIENVALEYIALSSVFRLSSVTTPMLIAVGDRDVESLLDAIEIFNGLRRNGKTVTLLRYRDQDHVLTGDALADLWRRELDFFDRWIGSRSSNIHNAVSPKRVSGR